MNIIQCKNGHYYDQEKETMCPFCRTEPCYPESRAIWEARDSSGRLRVTLEDGKKYLLEDELGKGSVAKVYEMTYEERYALKMVCCSNSQVLHRARHEAEMIKSFAGNPNILALHHYEEQELEDKLYAMMLLEKAQVLSLDKPMEFGRAAAMIRDICHALISLEEKEILHLDIKTDNIYQGYDGRWKLGDFSHACTLSELEKVTEPIGAFAYMAPEIINECRFDKTADIYSLGIVMFRCFGGGAFPFFKLSSKRKPEDLLASDSIPREILDVINKAAAFYPEARYQTAKELLNAFETAWDCFRKKYGEILPEKEQMLPAINLVQLLKELKRREAFMRRPYGNPFPRPSVFTAPGTSTVSEWETPEDEYTVP